jgi:photosynthetic reaction center cytochrome c subunit
MRNYPPPTNLQVLPKDLTGRQVRDIMEKWQGSLGVKCEFCHTADPKNVGPSGRPRMDFANDSKPNKQIARIMYTMTQQMNKDYISKAMDLDKDGMGSPVTCGTCHRGHEMPEEFVIPREEHRGSPGGGEGTPPPAETSAPPSN